MTLTIVCDLHTEGHAIYIDGMLRGEWAAGELTPDEFIDCYSQFCAGEPVALERLDIDSQSLGIYIESETDDGSVDFPEQLGELLKESESDES